MATTLQKGLLGYDPVEMQLQQQKMWTQLYGQAGSPYEKMGIGLAQLGGALFGGESASTSKLNILNEIKNKVGQQYQEGTADYFKAVADELRNQKGFEEGTDFATQKYLEAKKAESLEFAAERKGVREDPGAVDVYAPKYATTLLNKARAKGFDPTTEAVPETTEEIKAFAKLYSLDTDPAYNKFMTLRTLSEKEAKKEAMEAEKSALTMESIRTTIAKNKKEINKIDNDKFEAGARWNEERNSAIALFDANKLDPRVPLKGINLGNTELVNAQRIALRDPWTGKSGSTIKQPGETTPPPGGGKPASAGGDIGQQASSAFGKYEPNLYDYRIVNGIVQRARK